MPAMPEPHPLPLQQPPTRVSHVWEAFQPELTSPMASRPTETDLPPEVMVIFESKANAAANCTYYLWKQWGKPSLTISSCLAIC